MRMAADELGIYLPQDIAERELAGLTGNLGMKYNLQEQIPQLATEPAGISVIEGLKHLVALFEEILP